jgi:outer membrane protein assembly factor BamB
MAAGAHADENWSRFRGPNGTGVSDLKGIPTQWTQEDYEWVVTFEGIGHSSPVIWDYALFVTTGTEDGERTLLRLDATTGDEVWSQSLRLGANTLHTKNSYASSTPTVDGERVYVIHADADQQLVLAYTFDGDKVWERNIGTFESQHGQGVSPIVYQDLLIVPNDQAGPSNVVALNRNTGDVVWEIPRAPKEVSYATPFVLELEDREPQLILLSEASGLSAVNPLTGDEYWHTGAMPLRTVASAVYGGGVIVVSCGQGGVGKYLRAVDPTGSGDVSSTHVRYEREEKDILHYVPTPIMWQDHAYLWCDRGFVCCVEAATGTTVWTERIGGNYSGSPVLIDGWMYCMSEEGDVVVLKASPEFEEPSRSPLGDGSHATPAVANGRLYLRGFSRLASLKSRPGPVVGGGGGGGGE